MSTEDQCNALEARIIALEKMMNDREEWTKERFATMQQSILATLTASDRAIAKAEASTEERFRSVNEFRAALQDQTLTLMPRAEYNLQHGSLLSAHSAVTERLNALERTAIPRAEYDGMHGALSDRVTLNTKRIDILSAEREGRQQGLSLVGQVVFGVIAAITAMAAGITAFFHR